MKKSLSFLFFCLAFILFYACKNTSSKNKPHHKYGTYNSPLGKEIISAPPSKKLVEEYEKSKLDFQKNPEDINNIIWYGRRTAYLGRYKEAIGVYTKGIEKFPENPRLYRHRGHRYISIRKFDEAISDLEKAGELIQDKENVVEQDGMPNALNIPVSTLHGNIWYHLGLAYYLKHDYENAYKAYLKCRESGTNDDNLVSSTHWLYMIQKRLKNNELAQKLVDTIDMDATIIENINYYKLCKFYKGLLPIDSLLINKENGPSSDAVKYGLANWYFYNNKKEKSKEILENILDGVSWNSFGYIAAESDFITYFNN